MSDTLSKIFDELGEKFTALTEDVERDAYKRGVMVAVRLLRYVKDTSAAELRLQGGEMTAQEIRILRAWLGALAGALQDSLSHNVKEET